VREEAEEEGGGDMATVHERVRGKKEVKRGT